MNFLLSKNMLHCTMVMNKPNDTYIRHKDIQSKMEYYSIAHKIVKSVWSLFFLYILCSILLPILSLVYKSPTASAMEQNNGQSTIENLYKQQEESYIMKIRHLMGKGIAYMFLLKEIITVVLCFLSILSLLNAIRNESTNKTARVIDTTENIINIVIAIMLLQAFWVFMNNFNKTEDNENLLVTIYKKIKEEKHKKIVIKHGIADPQSHLHSDEIDKHINERESLIQECLKIIWEKYGFSVFKYLILLFVRWLIGKIFNKTYDLFDIKLETEPSEPIKTSEHNQLQAQ